MPGESWRYESRRERRRKQIMALQEAASSTLEPLQRGDVTAARRALKQEQYEQEEDPWANVPERDSGIPDTGATTPTEFSPGMQKAGLAALNFVGRTNPLSFSPDVPEREPEQKRDWRDLGLDLVKAATVDPAMGALKIADKAGDYTLRPAFGIASGLRRAEREPIYDDKGNIVGYSRDTATIGQAGKSILDAFQQDPRKSFREGRQAYEEYANDPEKKAFHRIAAAGVTDPASYIGPGLARLPARFLPAAVRSNRVLNPLGRLGANLIESPSRASGGGILGAAVGGQIAENEEWGPGASMAAMLGGGLLGGAVGGGLTPKRALQGIDAISAMEERLPGVASAEAGEVRLPTFGSRDAGAPAGIAPALTAEDAAMGLPDLEGVTIFNLPEITPKPLTKTDHVMNEVVHSVTGKAREEPIATTAMRERERLKHVVDSAANGLALKTTALAHRAFKFDKQERIVDLPGQPTLSVLAARLPDFLPHMSIAQREAIAQIQREIEPFINLLRLKGIDFGTRPDIIEGGFYLPRGSAEKAGMKKVAGAGRGRRGRSGYRQHAKYESMIDAMEANWEYKSFPEAMQALGRQVGMDAVNRHIEDYFKNVATPEGFKIGSTATERMNPVVRAKWKDVTARVVSARARLITAEKRAKVATTAADEVDDAIQRFEEGIPDEGTRNISKIGEKLETEAMRGEKLRERADVLRGPKNRRAMTGGGPVRVPKMDATEAEVRRADLVDGKAAELERVVASIEKNVPDDVDKLANIETALRHSIKRAETLAARGDEYSDEALSLRDELDLLSDEIDALRPEYKVALDNARSPAHYEGGIGGPGTALSGLQGYGFPEEVAAAANKYLDKELKQKSVQGAVMAFNQLVRGLKATLDVSFIGIQGALGAARDPAGFGRAQAIAWKSMADSDALGKYLLDFDRRAIAQGRPTSAQWQAAGLRTGGSATEFQIGSEGVGRFSDAIARKPGIRHSNRMFGNFGDVLRMELAHHSYGSANGFTTAGLGKFDLTDPKSLESLADAANRATGWSRSRAGGDLGELILFAPRFFQSQLEFLTQAAGVHGFNTPGAWEARRTLVSFLGVGVGLSVLANEMADELGGEKIPWEEFWDPRTSNFLRFRIAGQDTTIFGPWDSLVRSMVRTAQGLPGVPGEGDPTYILRSKASPAVNLAWGLITDENAIGRENFRSPGNIIKELVVPFSFSDSDVLGGGQTANQTLLGAAGIKSTPVTPKEEFDRLARAEYGMNYYDLAPRDQHAMKKAHPEMWERVVEKGNKLRIQGEEVKQRYVSEQEARDADLLSGSLSVEQWEEARDDAYSRKDGEMSQIYKDSDYEGKDARLNDYFAAADNWTRNGVFDFEARNAYIEGLSEADQKYLEENTGLNATPLEKLRKRLSGEYYELPRWRGYTADEARQIDEIWQEIRNNARNAETGSMLIAKRKSGVDIERYGKRVRKGVMGRILGWLSLDNDREKYLKKNPAARVLISARGNLTPAMIEAVEAEM